MPSPLAESATRILPIPLLCQWCAKPSDADDPEDLCSDCRAFVEDLVSGEANAAAADAFAQALLYVEASNGC